jgi:S1-C subfamily serine protease
MLRSTVIAANLLALVFVSTVFLVPTPLPAADGENAIQTAEAQLQSLYHTASPAIVRFATDETGEHKLWMTGVIVSADGHIANCVRSELRVFSDRKAIFCFLPDGRHAKCEPLGWSEAWNVGLLKITEPGPWPHVEISTNANLAAGQLCAGLEYEWGEQIGKEPQERAPQLRVGSITRCAPQVWFTASCRVDGWTPLFAVDGSLIGITTERYYRYDIHATRAELIKKYWIPLTAGKNLDRELLAGDVKKADHTTSSKQRQEINPESDVVKAAIEKAAAATIRIRRFVEMTNRFSGVIVSADGYIATCAHHFGMPGEPVSIELPDGRDAAGKVLGVDRIADISLVKITEQGEWPHVEMGESISAAADQPCWCIGYPTDRKDRTAWVRQSKIAESGDKPFSHLVYASKETPLRGGDSGGGLFDANGRLIGSFEGQNPNALGRYHRIGLFRQEWDFLSAGQSASVIAGPPLAEFVGGFTQIIERGPNVVVEILSDNKPCALGTVVAADGKVVTKASELYGAASVRLPDGKTLPATIQKYSRDYDLALLTIVANDLPAAKFALSDSLAMGKLVAAPVPGQNPRVGVVSYAVRALPSDRGAGLFTLADTTRGVEVIDDKSARELGMLIRKGDLIRRIEGQETPDTKAVLQLVGESDHSGTLIANAGDSMTVTVEREKVSMELHFPRPPAVWPRPQMESHRYTGFPEVFDIDAPLEAHQCGGPVIDIAGQLLGVTIAARGSDETTTHIHVIPAAVVKKFISE